MTKRKVVSAQDVMVYTVISRTVDAQTKKTPGDRSFDHPSDQYGGLLRLLRKTDGGYVPADHIKNGKHAHVFAKIYGDNELAFITVRADEEGLMDGKRVHLRIGGTTRAARLSVAKDIRKKGYALTNNGRRK